MNSEIAIDEQNLYEDFIALEKGSIYNVELYGLVNVEYKVRWEIGLHATIVVLNVTPSESLTQLFIYDLDELCLYETVLDHLYNTKGINHRWCEFNEKIKQFNERAEKWGLEVFNDKDYFFKKYAW